MIFNGDITTMGLEIIPADEVNEHVTMAIIVGMNLPVAADRSVQVPAGVFRIRLGRDPAIRYGIDLQAAGEAMPEPAKQSDIITASSMADVERLAQAAKNFKGE